jgi:hypothetical protein
MSAISFSEHSTSYLVTLEAILGPLVTLEAILGPAPLASLPLSTNTPSLEETALEATVSIAAVEEAAPPASAAEAVPTAETGGVGALSSRKKRFIRKEDSASQVDR